MIMFFSLVRRLGNSQGDWRTKQLVANLNDGPKMDPKMNQFCSKKAPRNQPGIFRQMLIWRVIDMQFSLVRRTANRSDNGRTKQQVDDEDDDDNDDLENDQGDVMTRMLVKK